MKLGTHRIVNLAVALTLYPALGLGGGLLQLALLCGSAILADTLIDGIGHRHVGRSPFPKRAWWTHQPLTAAITGGVGGAILAYIVTYMLGILSVQPPTSWMLLAPAAGAFAGQIHLLLDLPTGSGIYLTCARRLRVGHLSWDNGFANTSLIILSLLLIFSVFAARTLAQ